MNNEEKLEDCLDYFRSHFNHIYNNELILSQLISIKQQYIDCEERNEVE